MSNVVQRGKYRIDEYSQRMLSALTDGEKTVSQLRDESGLDEWESADYRLREHLIPGGWVEKVGENPKTMSLTPDGQELIETEGFDSPTLSEVRETALEASETAQSARESADRFRKQLYQVRQRLDRVNDLEGEVSGYRTEVRELERMLRTNIGEEKYIFDKNYNSIQSLRREISQLETKLDEYQGESDAIEELHQRVHSIERHLNSDETSDELDQLDSRHKATRAKITELTSAHNSWVDRHKETKQELETRLTEQEQRITELEAQLQAEQEKSLLSRLWPV